MTATQQSKTVKFLILGVLIIVVAWQGVQFIKFSADQIPTVWTWIGKPVKWRSAAYSTSEFFADYVALANEIIPADTAVAIPGEDYAPWQFSHMTYMQYQLFPREVFLCSSTDCLIQAASDGNFALITDLDYFFSIPEAKYFKHQVIEFNQKWGILTPEERSISATTPLESFTSLKQIGAQLVLPGLWLLAVAVPGLFLISAILPDWRWLSRFFLGITLGLGFISFLIYLLLLLTQTLSTLLIMISTSLWWLTAYLAATSLAKKTGQKSLNLKNGFKISIFEIIVLAIGLVVAFISIGKSYWGTDGMILWANKGYGIAAFGLSTGVSNWGTWAAHYPLQNPILISIFKILFGDTVPESKILPVIFYVAIPLIATEFFRTKSNSQFYIWPILLWMLSPFVIRQGTIGYANLSFTFYLIAAVIITVANMAQTEITKQSNFQLILSGGLFAIAAWTRPEGTVLCFIVMVILVVIQRKEFKTYWIVFLPLLFYSITWALTKNIAYLNPSGSEGYTLDGVMNVIQGNIIWGDAIYLSKSFFQKVLSLESWGLLIWVLLAGKTFLRGKRNSTPQTNSIIFAGILITLAALTIIYLKTYNPAKCDVSCMVNTAMERLVLPGIGLIWVGVSNWIISLYHNENSELI